MDSKETKIKVAVNKTLQVPDNIQRVAGNPYLLTRIQARLQAEPTSPQTSLNPTPLLPALILGILVLNSFILFKTLPIFNSTENNVLTELIFPSSDVDAWYEYSN